MPCSELSFDTMVIVIGFLFQKMEGFGDASFLTIFRVKHVTLSSVSALGECVLPNAIISERSVSGFAFGDQQK